MLRFRLVALSMAALLFPQPALRGAQGTDPKSKPDTKRPTLSVKASPPSGLAPIRVFLTAELKGGRDDYEDLYCPTVEWTWGDGTVSQSSADCDPFEAGRSTILRRYSVQHVYQLPGRFQVQLRLKKKDKPIVTAATSVQIAGASGPYGP
jgi:hypothetical protein